MVQTSKVPGGMGDGDALPSRPVLICQADGRDSDAGPLVSSREVFCGPAFQTQLGQDGFRSLAAPVGSYDLGPVAAALPEPPQLILVVTDGTEGQQPRQLQSFRC